MTGALYGDELGLIKPLASILSINSLRCGTKCTGVLYRRAVNLAPSLTLSFVLSFRMTDRPTRSARRLAYIWASGTS